jgi:protein O-mannosyl-transferase
MVEKIRKKNKPLPHTDKQAEKPKTPNSVIIGIVMAILLLTIIVYSNSINNDFISSWDDDVYIQNNIDIRDLTLDKALGFFKLDSIYSNNYHPLTLLSYAIEAKFFGITSSRHFHLVNLLLHLGNVCLVFYLIYLITTRWNIAAMVAVFFAVHPMHVESVAWISERKDVLYALFYLGSAILYLKYLKTKSGHRYLIASIALFLLSCLSKSMAVSLPVLLLLLDYLTSRKFSKSLIIEKIPYFIIALLFSVLAMKSQSQAIVANIALQIGSVDRIFIVFYGFIYYLIKLFFPFSLSAVHYYPEKHSGWLPILFYAAPIATGLILFGAYKAKIFKREIVFGLLFYLVALLPVIQIIPIGVSMVSERYSYIPYIGLLYIIGIAFNGLAEKAYAYNTAALYSVAKWILIVFIGVFAAISFYQNYQWKNGITLFTQVIQRYPQQSHGYVGRGVARMKENDLIGALDDYSHAIKSDAHNAEAYSNRSATENILQQYELSINDCKEAIRLKADLADAYNNCGVALSGQGKHGDSLSFFQKAVEKNPKHYIALNNIVKAKCMLAQCEEAIPYNNKAIDLNPYYAESYFSKGNIRQALNDSKGAIESYTKAINLDPTQAKAYRNRGLCFLNGNSFQMAASDLRKALSMDASDPDDFYDLGVAYFNMSQEKEACEVWDVAATQGQPEAKTAIAQFCGQ